MRLAVLSGDGLPVSGLLTVLRNLVHLLAEEDVVELPVVADLGYSWRPDKADFYPNGPASARDPQWLRSAPADPGLDPDRLADELSRIRADVAHADGLGPDERAALHARIEPVAAAYERALSAWLERHDPDYVLALNMTLSDAVPVTQALHAAARARWGDGRRRGGVVFWDHDLFGSYAVHEAHGRVYPLAPNEFTPLPQDVPWHDWVVVSERLRQEASAYPTAAAPAYLPNPLPVLRGGLPPERAAFLRTLGAPPDAPLLLAPVRIFPVKGLDVTVRFLTELNQVRSERGAPPTQLLIFGARDEDRAHADQLDELVQELGAQDDVHFLDGVPLESHEDGDGRWRPDEVDLLRLAAASGGAVVFTPNRPDVESVGLAPALAALAGLPCACTGFAASEEFYRDRVEVVHVDPADLRGSATRFDRWLGPAPARGPDVDAVLARNEASVREVFTTAPWRSHAGQLARALVVDDVVVDGVDEPVPTGAWSPCWRERSDRSA